jgi:hypothetical protein
MQQSILLVHIYVNFIIIKQSDMSVTICLNELLLISHLSVMYEIVSSKIIFCPIVRYPLNTYTCFNMFTLLCIKTKQYNIDIISQINLFINLSYTIYFIIIKTMQYNIDIMPQINLFINFSYTIYYNIFKYYYFTYFVFLLILNNVCIYCVYYSVCRLPGVTIKIDPFSKWLY